MVKCWLQTGIQCEKGDWIMARRYNWAAFLIQTGWSSLHEPDWVNLWTEVLLMFCRLQRRWTQLWETPGDQGGTQRHSVCSRRLPGPVWSQPHYRWAVAAHASSVMLALCCCWTHVCVQVQQHSWCQVVRWSRAGSCPSSMTWQWRRMERRCTSLTPAAGGSAGTTCTWSWRPLLMGGTEGFLPYKQWEASAS